MTRNLQKSKDKWKTQAKQKSKEIKGLNAIIDSTSLSSFGKLDIWEITK